MKDPGVALILFARAPAAAKTRLAATRGRALATRVAAALFRDALDRAEASGLGPRLLYWDGAAEHPLAGTARGSGWEVRPQCGSGLGARMRHAFAEVLRTRPAAILVGTDCPDLSPRRLRRAAAALGERDAVLAPAVDGGYVLLGLTRRAAPHLAALFGRMRWGGAEVAAATRRRLRGAGLEYAQQRALVDLDRACDLAALARRHSFLAAAAQGEKIRTRKAQKSSR